ncbi:hypothetical protein NP493_1389g00034 [Ridgeia piscesae]|uniref:Craniofacial development protein 2-like n=1 Tax=Ridgeia piscesae TaxID=27915 RepID=A0AAD9NE65_RIDPI|nr:hypothetical protein NP493_1389g00034 [Ridgeia piscesae]
MSDSKQCSDDDSNHDDVNFQMFLKVTIRTVTSQSKVVVDWGRSVSDRCICRKRGDDMWRMKSEILGQVCIDSRPVHFLSSIHPPEHDAAVLGAGKTVKRKGKCGERGGIDVAAPPCVHAYNKHMGGVDFTDRIIKYYNCAQLQQVFREELADALIGGYHAGHKCAGRPSDVYNSEARFQNVGSHHPSSDKSRDCALCTKKAKAACPGGVIPHGVSRASPGGDACQQPPADMRSGRVVLRRPRPQLKRIVERNVKIGSWNVGSMTGRELVEVCKRRNIGILCVREEMGVTSFPEERSDDVLSTLLLR